MYLEAERARESDESRLVKIEHFARIEHRAVLREWSAVEALEPEHIWKPKVIRDRFDYEGDQALSLAFVRVYRLPEPWTFPYHRSYGGCRSWITLPDSAPDTSDLTPVIDDAEHEARKSRLPLS